MTTTDASYTPSSSEPLRLGVLTPAILTTPQSPASNLPWAPAVGATNPLTVAQPAQAMPDGESAPTPQRTYPHPNPEGGPRPVPFRPAKE
jgi:hypothetical protein